MGTFWVQKFAQQPTDQDLFVRDAQDFENVERVISLGPREATLQLLPDGLKKVLIKLLIVFHFLSRLYDV